MRTLVERRFPFLKDQPIFPLAVLFFLNAVDEFDSRAFLTLGPEIRDEFGLSASGFGVIAGFTFVLVLLGGMPVGWISDRVKRTRLVLLAAALWSIMSVGTGFAPAIWILTITRFFSGTGRVFNETVHSSLLTDYYPQHLHGRIFGIHRAGNPVGLIFGGLMAGAIADLLGWRASFFIVAIPTLFVAFVALRLREPLRGEAEDASLAAEAAQEAPIPLARGWRWLFSVPSLKRFYITAFFAGGTIFALSAFIAQFFEEIYGVGATGRGLLASSYGVADLLGIIIGGIMTDRLRSRSLGKISFMAAMAVFGIAFGVLLLGLSPNFPVAVAASLLLNFSIGLWRAPNISVLVIVVPARIRSLGIGVGLMFFGVGGLIFTVLAGAIADASGFRAAITTLAPFLFIGAAIYAAASRFVNADGEQALRALALEVELRHERMSAGSESLLVCRGLDVAYDGVQVLFDVDFQVRKGEIVALLGTNGAGKSTLLRAISGTMHPVGGAVFFDGENVSFFEPHETAAAGIVQVPGGRGVFPSLSVKENLETATWLFRRDAEAVKRALEGVLEVFPILRDRWDTKAGDLSGGEQQMVTLAQAFINRPKLLMIDELTLGLAPKLVEQLLDAVKAFHARGTTIILVEQSVNLALTVAETAYFLEKGEVRFSGPAADLVGRTDLIRSVFLEGAGRRKLTPATSKKTPADLAEGLNVLEVLELSVSYGGIKALDEVSLELKEGEILGVIGPNGAGKTTLFDLISGFLIPTSGRILLLGEDVTALSPEARASRGLGRSFQDARLFPSLTVSENIRVALERHLEVREPIAAALGLPAVRQSERAATAKAEELITRMGLEAFRDKFVHELSTGSRRIVDIACSLAHGPKVLILDEPSSGIAQAETEALGPLLTRVREELGCSMLVIEHDVPLVSGIADRMIALDLGRKISTGTPLEVVRDQRVVTAYLGTREEAIARSGVKPNDKRLGGQTSKSRKTGAKSATKGKNAPKRATKGRGEDLGLL